MISYENKYPFQKLEKRYRDIKIFWSKNNKIFINLNAMIHICSIVWNQKNKEKIKIKKTI